MGSFHQFIPSPTRAFIELGPLTIHFYAIAILTGIAVAIYWGNARFVAAGGAPGRVSEVAIVAVPMGFIMSSHHRKDILVTMADRLRFFISGKVGLEFGALFLLG